MKIGIMTFHWATNYGALLQAYALQSFLTRLGNDVQIIDYMPVSYEKRFIKCFKTKRPWRIMNNLSDYFKEQSLIPFRKRNFNLTIRYKSLDELKLNPPECDVYICGSDQIWNPFFTTGGEGKVTTSYFLDFGNEKTMRIAYAASFGCTEYTKNAKRIVAPILAKFDAISVREKTGIEIVRNMGFKKASLMPDPTLLLSAENYDEIIDNAVSRNDVFNFVYAIHDRQYTLEKIENYIRDQFPEPIVSTREFWKSMIDLTQWLSFIKTAKTIITNSFHGVVFSIIFRRQFIAVPVEGSAKGMNDRIYTLLDQLGLRNRICDNFDPSKISVILSEQIDWNNVEEKIQILRKEAEQFLSTNIHPASIDKYSLIQNMLVEVGA